MIEKQQWYIIYTLPGKEQKVANQLQKKGIENYCPLNRVKNQARDKKKVVQEPLFKSYVFVHTMTSGLKEIMQMEGVVNFVFWLTKPVVVEQHEIDVIRQFLARYEGVALEKTPVSVTESMQILNTPHIDIEGQLLSIRNKSVKVLLPSLGYTMLIDVTNENSDLVRRDMLRNVF